jgi:hypothetical protein
MTPDRKKPGVVFWATVVVVVGVAGYALVPGPAAYLWKATGRKGWPEPIPAIAQFPYRICKAGPAWLERSYGAYLDWWLSLAG